jgi:hypothetical protein
VPPLREAASHIAFRDRQFPTIDARRLESALGPHETLDGVRQQKEIGLAVWRVVLDDLFGRDDDPVAPHPCIPAIFRVSFVASLDFELRLYGISDSATKERFGVRLALSVLIVVGALQILKPSLVGAVRPLSPATTSDGSARETVAARPAAMT